MEAPLKKRVVFNMDEGQPNMTDIEHGNFLDYDLSGVSTLYEYL